MTKMYHPVARRRREEMLRLAIKRTRLMERRTLRAASHKAGQLPLAELPGLILVLLGAAGITTASSRTPSRSLGLNRILADSLALLIETKASAARGAKEKKINHKPPILAMRPTKTETIAPPTSQKCHRTRTWLALAKCSSKYLTSRPPARAGRTRSMPARSRSQR